VNVRWLACSAGPAARVEACNSRAPSRYNHIRRSPVMTTRSWSMFAVRGTLWWVDCRKPDARRRSMAERYVRSGPAFIAGPRCSARYSETGNRFGSRSVSRDPTRRAGGPCPSSAAPSSHVFWRCENFGDFLRKNVSWKTREIFRCFWTISWSCQQNKGECYGIRDVGTNGSGMISDIMGKQSYSERKQCAEDRENLKLGQSISMLWSRIPQ